MIRQLGVRHCVLIGLAVTLAACVPYAPRQSNSADVLPSKRRAYRDAHAIDKELRLLQARWPGRTRYEELPFRTHGGQPIGALTISNGIHESAWKPTLLIVGLQHAREWPSAELPLEFAWDLLTGSDRELSQLLDSVQITFLPTINPDGHAASMQGAADQKRKNCAPVNDAARGQFACMLDGKDAGVDLNRNFGSFWGGDGSSAVVSDIKYRGQTPFSEPEVANVLHVLLNTNVVVVVSVHTRDSIVLHLPGSQAERIGTDSVVIRALADSLAHQLSLPSGSWADAYYPVGGTLDQSAYYGVGAIPVTLELMEGHSSFHPAYQYVIAQYHGFGRYRRSSAREAFRHAVRNAAARSNHSVLTVSAPPGARLEASRQVRFVTADGQTVRNPEGGAFRQRLRLIAFGETTTWHLAPSKLPQLPIDNTATDPGWTVECIHNGSRDERHVSVTRGQVAEVRFDRC